MKGYFATAVPALGLLAGSETVPEAPAAADILINGSRVHPESITADAAGNIYVGSVGGTIYRALAGSTTAEPWVVPSAQNGLTSLFGVLADDRHGLLWVCNNPPFGGPPQPGAKSALRAFDMASGRLSAVYDLPGEGPFACNDIAFGPGGETFATDTAGGRIFVLEPNANELALFAADPGLVGVDGSRSPRTARCTSTTSASTRSSGSSAAATRSPGSLRSPCRSRSTAPTRCGRSGATVSCRPKAPATA
jgi:hypothetical protein